MGVLNLPANLPLFNNTASQQSYLGNAQAGLNQSGTAFQSSPTGLYNAGQNASVGSGLVSTGGGGKLASATGTSGNVPIQGPPPAPGSSSGPGQWTGPSITGAGVTTPPLKDGSGNDTPFGQLVKVGKDRNPIQERDYQRMLAEWNASHPQPLPTPPPVTAPPPTPTPQATITPKPIGGTAVPTATGTGGGVAGQAFPATSQLGLGTKGLQLAGLAPQAVSAQMAPTLPKGQPTGITPDFVSRLQQSTGANAQQTQGQKPQLQGYFPEKDTGEAKDVIRQLSEGIQGFLMGGRTGPIMHPIQHAGTQQMGASGSSADINLNKINTPQAITKSVLGAQGIQQNPIQNPLANPATLGGSIPISQHPQAIQSFLSGQSPMQTVASAIASPQALQTIGTMFNQAQQTGDTQTAQQLANLHSGVQQQLDFIDKITQMINAISGGFGTPNAPGVTEQRTPMVQAGIGGALTTPTSPQTPGGAPGQNVQMWTPQLPTAPVQQNKPILNPYMG